MTGPFVNEMVMRLKQVMVDFPFMKYWQRKRPAALSQRGRTEGLSQAGEEGKGVRMRLLSLPSAVPTTEIEHSTVKLLREKGEVDFDRVLREVARQVYLRELRRGSAVDIGLWGPGLFLPQVAQEIRARDGELWKIG